MQGQDHEVVRLGQRRESARRIPDLGCSRQEHQEVAAETLGEQMANRVADLLFERRASGLCWNSSATG